MHQVNVYEAKTHLSQLLELATSGEDVIIARAGKPVARLVPVSIGNKRRKLGLLDGEFSIPDSDDFNASLPDDVLYAFEDD